MPVADLFMYLFLALGAITSIITKKLTIPAAVTGVMVGLFVFQGAGYPGIVMLSIFFISGSWATSWQKQKKQLMNRSEKQAYGRTVGQVLANGGMAAILGGLAWLMPYYTDLAKLMMAGSLAAANADTLSSELGTIYGRNFYNILTLKKDQHGLDGVVSLEGTLIGIGGAMIIALIYSYSNNRWNLFLLVVTAGFTGNTIDSVLGATLERNGRIGNNTVNFLNTLTGALTCLLLNGIF